MGNFFKISTYGESHGKAIGVIIDGCPSGIEIDKNEIQNELERRKPGQSKITTQRKENDLIEILSGIFKGKTTGAPISLIINNKDQKVVIMIILQNHLDHHMPIIHTIKNIKIETTEVEEEALQEKLQIG